MAAPGRVMSPVGVSFQMCPGVRPIEASNAQVVDLHGVKVPDVHRHAAVLFLTIDVVNRTLKS